MKDQTFSCKNLCLGVLLGALIVGLPWFIIENTGEETYANLLEKNELYRLPVGAAEISAYYTTVEEGTTLDDSGPTVTCSALVVVDGPEILMEALSEERYGMPPTVVIGSGDSNWAGINDSSKSNPAKLLVTLNSMFEGDHVGCMSTTFNSFVVVE